MFKLMVSHNLGQSYFVQDEADDPDSFKKQIDQLNKDYIRWYIEKEKIISISPIHQSTVDFLS